MKKNGFTLIELLIVVCIIGILAAILIPAIIGVAGVSEGTRAGTVVKLSKKGIACKSWEGELVLNESGTYVWPFTVESDDVADQVQKALDSGERVRLTYVEKTRLNPCTGDTRYTVTAVTPVNPQG